MSRRPLNGSPRVSCDDACHHARGSAGGTDYAVGVGTPVYAMFPGRAYNGWNSLAGCYIRVDGDNGHVGYLMHLSKSLIVNGQRVDEVGQIADSGGTKGTHCAGSASGPHLHANVDISGKRWGMEEYLAAYGAKPAGGGEPIKESETDMKIVRHPNGTITAVGEVTYQHYKTPDEYKVDSLLHGVYLQCNEATYNMIVANTQVRKAYLLAGLTGTAGSTIDTTAIATKVKASLATDFTKLASQIAAINAEIGTPPTPDEIIDALQQRLG